MSSWLDELLAIDQAQERARALETLPEDAPAQIHREVLAALYSDPARARSLAEIGHQVAEHRPDAIAAAFSARCDGHVAYAAGQHERAVASYETALGLFDQRGEELESARTLSSALQPLILQGRYDQARAWAARAEGIFLKHGDQLRLARLDSNVGNIFFRLDQPREAIVRYQRAMQRFRTVGDAKDRAAVLSNLAVCHTSLGHAAEAFSFYQQARATALDNGLAPLAAQADYNIAYLHYLRGDYLTARDLYGRLRQRSRENGDAYHAALCDLDEAELDLELNLTREGEALASRAAAAFDALEMRYEQAKAMVNLAVAGSQRSARKFADAHLRRARKLFAGEGNRVWMAIVDLLRSVLAYHEHRYRAARSLSSSAWRVLSESPMPGRAAHCQILLARLRLAGGDADRARSIARAALERLGAESPPSLRFHVSLVEAEANESQGLRTAAVTSYQAARLEIESLRGRVDSEDLRISILKDKLSVYEALVSIYLDCPGGEEQAMLVVQQAKSRSLADRLSTSIASGAAGPGRFEELRKDLNWCYRQIDAAGLSSASTTDLRARARQLENELLQYRSEPVLGPAPEPAETIAALQEHISTDACLLEYFEARGVLYVFLLSRTRLEMVRLGPAAQMWEKLKLLRFQLEKFRPDEIPSAAAANHHLRGLYNLLIGPLASKLEPYRHLIIAPHRQLHGLPFAALHDGKESLVDRFPLSTTPSARVYAECGSRKRQHARDAVVLAVPDPRAPYIAEEARIVSESLPGSRLISGSGATFEALRSLSPAVRIVHLATHGVLRRDNPWFSSLRLADGNLTLIDLQSARLEVELATLSACNTGSAVPVGGDELLGLMRGFLTAGARNLLVSLWDVHDASTKEFMQTFYAGIAGGTAISMALRDAMLTIREKYPHPFHWAPFVLVGGYEE